MFLKNVIYFLKFLTYLLSRPFGNIIMNLSFYLDSVMQNSVVVWLIGCAHFRARFLFFIPMDTSDIFSQGFFSLKFGRDSRQPVFGIVRVCLSQYFSLCVSQFAFLYPSLIYLLKVPTANIVVAICTFVCTGFERQSL